jgi:hypothetical protein
VPIDWLRRLLALTARPPMVIVEDPEDLGYRLVADPLLQLMTRDEWRALETRALALEP